MESKAVRTFVLSFFMLTLSGICTAATLQTAMTAQDRGDYASAFPQFKQLAAAGDAAAQFQLSILYGAGRGTKQNANEALHWLRMSAAHGNPQAQSNLGVAFSKGRGVAQDPIRAWVWFSAAASSGDSVAATNRDVVARKLSEQEISQAKALLIDCQSSEYKSCL
jgi:TPR repeat protein